MAQIPPDRRGRHRHFPVTSHVIAQRSGIPFEIARVVCSTCGLLLEERPLRRKAP